MLAEIKDKTTEIVEIVVNENFDGKIGVLSGTAGSLFLLCYYSEYTKNTGYLDVVEQRIMDAFDVINDTSFSDLTFSNGLTGFLWTLKNLNEHQYIDMDLSEVEDSGESLLGDFMMNRIEEGSYDFLHGALGVANYFLDIAKPSSLKMVNDFNDFFLASALRNAGEGTVSFASTVDIEDTNTQVINLSLSHGMASIIYYLQRCLKNKKTATEEIKKSLEQVIAFYKRNQNDLTLQSSYFPSWVKNEIPDLNSRLAWCYGDLGVGHVFSLAADTLKDAELKAYSIEILKNTLTRLDPIKESIMDGGICHGASGLVKMYRTIYRSTGIADFNKTADYWLKITLQQATHADGYAGYKTYTDGKWENNSGLLEGVAGIGILFLEELMEKPLGWDRALMLS